MDNIFDLNTTDIPIYDDLLHKRKDSECGVKVAVEVVKMNPREYFKRCAELQGGTLKGQFRMISKNNVKELIDVVKSGEKLPLPMIDYVYKGQEGRHRAIVSKLLKKPFYVMIVKELK